MVITEPLCFLKNVTVTSILMLQFIIRTFLISLVIIVLQCSSLQLKSGSRVLVIGDRIAFDGNTSPYGFIQLIQNVLNSLLNFQFESLIELNSFSMSEQLRSYMSLDSSYHPNIIFVMLGTQMIIDNVLSEHIYEHQLRKVMIQLNSTNCSTIIVFSPFLCGERYDGGNEYDLVLEEVSAVSKQVAKEFKAFYIDIRVKLLKYLEKYNIENLDHSVLTFDGYHFNPNGHSFIAYQILNFIGMKKANITLPMVQQHQSTSFSINRKYYHQLLFKSNEEMNNLDTRKFLDTISTS
jgi:hypothetical protein